MAIETRDIIVTVACHPSGAMVAESAELPGLMVPGRSIDQIVERLPTSIRDLLEAQGFEVKRIYAEPDTQSDGWTAEIKAHAELSRIAA